MENLLHQYCKLNSVSYEDMIGKSRAKGLSRHRHVFAYCIKKAYPSIKLWQIGEILKIDSPSSIHFGINSIKLEISPTKVKGKIVTPPRNILITIKLVDSFLGVCKLCKRSELILPEKD